MFGRSLSAPVQEFALGYSSLRKCVEDLERHGHLVRVTEEVDPHLEMAEIHRRVFDAGGPAVYYERVKGSPFPAVSNLYGSLERSRFIFRDTIKAVAGVIQLRADPSVLFKQPLSFLKAPFVGLSALPKRKWFGGKALYGKTNLDRLPQVKSWPMDGGPFVTLPQVYTEDAARPGWAKSNLGMYRVQLGGNDYRPNEQIGLHYQIHRGIGVHHARAIERGVPFRASVFVGGPPAHAFAAVMPLPEGLPEVTFAGALAGRRFRYARRDGHVISTDADFCICGVVEDDLMPEGPFGDHLGYYSLTHNFPALRVEAVYHRKDAIWPFTVVGRPPQEDTFFGALIHELTGPMVPASIPGLREMHAVDAAGVHPLLLAIGSERYLPYVSPEERRPMEILTIANAVLGFGQASLAKYLIIAAGEDDPDLNLHEIEPFLLHVLRRVDWARDLHFQTATTIDTLDYSGTALNEGSKLVIAAAGPPRRELATELPSLRLPADFTAPVLVLPGVLAIQGPEFTRREQADGDIQRLAVALGEQSGLEGFPLIVVVDDSDFTGRTLNNFLWSVFTRSNPSHDVHGVKAFTEHKHWGCRGPLLIDARRKPYLAPPLEVDPDVARAVDRLGATGGSLHGII